MTDPDPTEFPSYNTPVDDPHHYDFSNADVPLNPDEQTPPGHRAHQGGYQLDEDVDIVAAVVPKQADWHANGESKDGSDEPS